MIDSKVHSTPRSKTTVMVPLLKGIFCLDHSRELNNVGGSNLTVPPLPAGGKRKGSHQP